MTSSRLPRDVNANPDADPSEGSRTNNTTPQTSRTNLCVGITLSLGERPINVHLLASTIIQKTCEGAARS